MKIYLERGGDNGKYINGNDFNYSPGDQLVLRSTDEWSYCSLENFHGTPQNPVTIINEGGIVHLINGFEINNCSYIRIRGVGDTSILYGFLISDPSIGGPGIDIKGKSNHIRVRRCEVTSKLYGMWVKNDADCDDSINYPNTYLDHIAIVQNNFHHLNQEGVYLGNTDPAGTTRTINCGGLIKKPIPTRLSNIQVYNNIFNHTNRSAIQLSGADKGNNLIYNNSITDAGLEFNNTQGAGIWLGGETQAEVYENNIANTFLQNIISFGIGTVKIHDNVMSGAGVVGGHTNNGYCSILIDTRVTNPFAKSRFIIQNNSCGTNTDTDGNKVAVLKSVNSYEDTGNIVTNSGKLYVVPGVNFTT